MKKLLIAVVCALGVFSLSAQDNEGYKFTDTEE